MRPAQQASVSPLTDKQPFAFTAPLGLAQPIDSYTCKTPWSVFQDGSKLPPIYSVEFAKDGPQHAWLLAVRARLKPVGPGARTPGRLRPSPKTKPKLSPGPRVQTPTVPTVATGQRCTEAARPRLDLTTGQLRGKLRLLPHSFTYC